MRFKEFTVDYNKLTIDGQTIWIPNYMSTTQWLEFWSFCDDANTGDSIEDRINEEVRSQVESNEAEHEEEMQAELTKLKNEFNDRIETIMYLLQDKITELGNVEDKIFSLKFKTE